MKKQLHLIILAFLFGVSGIAHAGTWTWANSGYSMGSYVPVVGSFSETWSSGYYVSTVSFSLDTYNKLRVIDYNNGYGNGGTCPGYNAYLTVDMTAVPNAWDEEISASYIYSNLPNPKFDFESDFGSDSENEESETVALGTVSDYTYYYMKTYWIDGRDGGANDGGNIQVQFAMSKQWVPWGDYNNCTTANGVQIINPYNNTYGSY